MIQVRSEKLEVGGVDEVVLVGSRVPVVNCFDHLLRTSIAL